VPLSAILLTGKRPSRPMTREYAYPQAPDLGPASLACVDVFGQSVMQRTINRLERAGVRATSVITTPDCVAFSANKNVAITITEKPADRWCAAERTLKKEAQRGVDTFLIAELGAYVELDLQDALRFHKAKGQPITCIHDSHGPLCFWLVDAAQVIASGKFPFPLDEEALEHPPIPYLVDAHVNRLSDAREFRQLVVDSFLGRCSIAPFGREIKAGVWIEEGARVHKTARLVAPVYIGRNTQVQPAAVITRFTNLEHDCNVGEGSLVADASILSHTVIGKGLDVAAALVDGSDYFHLDRNLMLRIQDPNWISDSAPLQPQVPNYLPEYEESFRRSRQLELEYSQYLSRAAGRLLEVFKGEV